VFYGEQNEQTDFFPQTAPETKIQKRVGYNTSGKEVEMMMNAYPITAFPDKTVWQYEVSFATC
jgi:eukaryotic translation initiation factor 2C